MTNGQIAQLQELQSCRRYGSMKLDDRYSVDWFLYTSISYQFDRTDKAELRRLMHQYRHQIAAMRKNRK